MNGKRTIVILASIGLLLVIGVLIYQNNQGTESALNDTLNTANDGIAPDENKQPEEPDTTMTERDKDSSKDDFTAWTEEDVYAFLEDVKEYAYAGYRKNFNSKEEIVEYFNRYFKQEYSEYQVGFYNYYEEEKLWKPLEAWSGGYTFFVPRKDEESKEYTIQIEPEFINLTVIYEIGMYSSIEYVIENFQEPKITEWHIDRKDHNSGEGID